LRRGGWDCEQEVRLNRRLAADIYLGVLPLVRDAEGRLRLDGVGETVDWLVQMRRLPAERMLDYLLHSGVVERVEIVQLARRLACFLCGKLLPRTLRPSLSERPGRRIEDNLRELGSPEFGLDPGQMQRLARLQLSFLQSHAEWFDGRVRQRRIVEGHGDLRPEHVCLLAEPVVIDCLEFNREFRILDTVDELGYLALECERLHAPQVGRWLLESYREASGDAPPDALIHFYQSCRAVLRAKLCRLAPARRRAASAGQVGCNGQGLSRTGAAACRCGRKLTLACFVQSCSSLTSEPPLCKRRMASANRGAVSSTATRLPSSAGGSRKGGMVSVTSTCSRAGLASTLAAAPVNRPWLAAANTRLAPSALQAAARPCQGRATADQVVDDEDGPAVHFANHRLA